MFLIRLRILPYSLSDLFVLREFKGKIIYVHLSEANYNVNTISRRRFLRYIPENEAWLTKDRSICTVSSDDQVSDKRSTEIHVRYSVQASYVCLVLVISL